MTTEAGVLELGLLLLLAVLAGGLARRLGLPAVVGYLAVGIAVSPFTPGYVADRAHLDLLANFGVVLLLFEVGLEVNLLRLVRESRWLLALVPAQVAITTLIAGGAAAAVGLGWSAAAVLGLAVAMSSSVVVVNVTRSRRRTTNPATDSALLTWSVVQDVTAVAAALLLLAFAGVSPRPALEAALGVGAFAVIVVAAAWALPRLLGLLRGHHDLFLLLAVGTGFAVAGTGAALGVPLALAAFVGGLAVSESPASAEARRRILPFRDLFAVIFFVLLGSLIDPGALYRSAGWLAMLLAAVVLAKVVPVLVLARVARLDGVRPFQLAIGLGQLGEFSFVLASLLLGRGLISADLYSAVLAAVVVSIALSAVAVRLAGRPEARVTVTAGG